MTFSVLIVHILLLCGLNLQSTFADYAACGSTNDGTTEAGLEENIAGHMTRLGSLRNADNAWENHAEVITVLQLVKTSADANGDESFNPLINELQVNASRMTLGEFSQYVLAAKALCQDLTSFGELNLVTELRRRLADEFTYNGQQHTSPRYGWYGLYLGLAAHCITQRSTPSETYVHNVLHSQNHDGSFDHSHSIDHTSQAMLSLICLSRSGNLSEVLHNKVENSLRRASEFLMSKVVSERADVWIGDKYSSPAGVLAINEYSQWVADAWRCRLIMKSLNRQHNDKEEESAIAQRLLALKGVSVLELMKDDYTCETRDAESSDTTNKVASEMHPQQYSCETDDVQPRYAFAQTLIDVHISIHPNAFKHGKERHIGSTHFTLTDVAKEKTLLELMAIAQCRGMVTFQTATTAWGEYITTINGVEATSENKEYWAIFSNTDSLTVGAGQFSPSHSDHIAFKLKKWQ